jgi:hypothetical protein
VGGIYAAAFLCGHNGFHNIAALKARKWPLSDVLVKDAQVPLDFLRCDRSTGPILLLKPLLGYSLKGQHLFLVGKHGGFLFRFLDQTGVATICKHLPRFKALSAGIRQADFRVSSEGQNLLLVLKAVTELPGNAFTLWPHVRVKPVTVRLFLDFAVGLHAPELGISEFSHAGKISVLNVLVKLLPAFLPAKNGDNNVPHRTHLDYQNPQKQSPARLFGPYGTL